MPRAGYLPGDVLCLSAAVSGAGIEAFFAGKRTPRSSPGAIGLPVVEAIVWARKELEEEGADFGAISVRWRLEDRGVTPLPCRATVHRTLGRAGLIVPQPQKRPTTSTTRRFEASAPNDMWQLDGFDYRLADGATVVVLSLLDDHSRLDIAELAARSENGVDAVRVFETGAAGYGLPRRLLTDNGPAFNGHRRGFTAALEGVAAALGVRPISSSVNHPQTCGKDERHHQTLRRWLAKQPTATDLATLQALLDRFRTWYNNRRHQGIAGLTPQQRWDTADRVSPEGAPIPLPPLVTRPTVSPRGAVGVDSHEIAVGKRHAGQRTVVFRTGDHVTVFIANVHIRTLTLDRTRDYQPLRDSTKHQPATPRLVSGKS